MKKALITGITGQDGSYLAELLLEKGYQVHAIVRRNSNFNIARIAHLFGEKSDAEILLEKGHQFPVDFKGGANVLEGIKAASLADNKLFLYYGDLSDSSTINKLVAELQPDEFYNLGAQSHVRVSFDIPEYTADVVAMGPLRILEAIRNFSPKTRFYQASSSEMYGKVKEVPQKETTPFHPRSPYGVAKVFGFWATVNYRESYDLHASNGILFNHESPRRGRTFVTRKITRTIAKIKLGKEDCLYLGNLDSKRDWGHARDYVEAMWLMLQQEKGDDYVVATGEMHTVRECVAVAAAEAGFDIEWQGEGVNEKGIDKATGKTIVAVNPAYFRPAEVEQLLGDPSKTKQVLNWQPKYTFDTLIREMVQYDLKNEAEQNYSY